MDTRTRNIISICTGYGGIELGLHAAMGGRGRTICYVENEASVAAILAARMEEGTLDQAPVWSNLTTFDPQPWCGKVDLLAGGPPCQPWSVAGSKKGAGDTRRNLWPAVERIAAGLGYPDLFLENVPCFLRYYWETIRPSLQGMGYTVAEGLFTAAETGAPHKTQRLFILAHRNTGLSNDEEEEVRTGWDATEYEGSELAHSNKSRVWNQSREVGGETRITNVRQEDRKECTVRLGTTGSELAHAERIGTQVQTEGEHAAEYRVDYNSEKVLSPFYPPGPDDLKGWAHLLDFMPQVEPTFCRDANGPTPGVDRRLRAIGNGVVPAVAAIAYINLTEILQQRGKRNERSRDVSRMRGQ